MTFSTKMSEAEGLQIHNMLVGACMSVVVRWVMGARRKKKGFFFDNGCRSLSSLNPAAKSDDVSLHQSTNR